MAAAIKKRFGVDAELIESGGGAFEVKLDGTRKLFSKLAEDRFPTDDEILASIGEQSAGR